MLTSNNWEQYNAVGSGVSLLLASQNPKSSVDNYNPAINTCNTQNYPVIEFFTKLSLVYYALFSHFVSVYNEMLIKI